MPGELCLLMEDFDDWFKNVVFVEQNFVSDKKRGNFYAAPSFELDESAERNNQDNL